MLLGHCSSGKGTRRLTNRLTKLLSEVTPAHTSQAKAHIQVQRREKSKLTKGLQGGELSILGEEHG